MRILAVGAHPDDVEVQCMGTLARFAKEGQHVTIAHACTGDKGHTTIPPEQLGEIRKAEARQAAALIGATCVCLEFADGELFVTDDAVHKFVDLIRRAEADLIITHPPADYHADHIATSKLVVDASFLASVPHYQTGTPALENVPSVYFMSGAAGTSFFPEIYVDISDTLAVKLQAMSKHASQLTWLRERYANDILEAIRVQARFYGVQCGVQYAEVFQHNRMGRVVPRRELP